MEGQTKRKKIAPQKNIKYPVYVLPMDEIDYRDCCTPSLCSIMVNGT